MGPQTLTPKNHHLDKSLQRSRHFLKEGIDQTSFYGSKMVNDQLPRSASDKNKFFISLVGTRKVSPSPKRYKYEKDAEDVYNTFDDESDQVWSSLSPIKDGSCSIPKLRDYSSKSSLLHRKHRPVMAPLTPSECRKQLNGNPRSGNTTPGKLRLQNSSGKINCRKSSPKACNGAKQSLDFYFSNSGSKNEGTNQNSDSPEFSEFGDEGNDKENIGTPCRKQRAVIAKIIDSLEEEEVDQLVEQSSCQDKLQNNGSDDVFDQLLKTSNSSFGEINSKKHGSDFRPWLSSSPSGKEEPSVRVQEPHEIGFPNPAGSNKCWMNATLQALLGLEPFIKELQCNFQQVGSSYSKKSNSAKVLSAFLDLVKSRQRGRQVAINTSLGTLSRSLGLLDAIFVSDCQQDAPEFLVRLLDCFREEFNQVRVSEKKLQDVDNFSLEDLQQAKENKDDLTKVHNPIKENFEFQLHETYSCIQCEERTTRHQDHLALFVDIPSRERGKCPSLQDALDHYMCPDLREMKCDKCGYTNSKVIPALHKLPRFLIIQVKRYTIEGSKTEKLTKALRIPMFISIKKYLTENVTFPALWKEQEASEEDCGNITDTPLAVGFDEEDKELQEALRQSLDEGQKQKQQEDIELEEAIKLSLFEHQIPTDTENNIYNQLSLDDKNEEMEESPELSYKIIGAITHHGFTPNSGHYVADVFSFHQHSWYHYDDETAQEKPEEDVLGHNLQCNGYVFFYMYRPLFDQMMSQRQESQDKDIMVK